MATLLFVAQISGKPGGEYHAILVDFPDCTVVASSLADTLTKARGAVLTRLQSLSDGGEGWPEPTPIQNVVALKHAITTIIDVSVDDPPVRVNLSIGERLLERLDASATERGMTRSGFVAHAVRVSLGETVDPAAASAAVGKRLQDELNLLGQRINDSIGPESAFGRRMIELDDVVYDGVRRAADSVSAAMSKRIAPKGEGGTSLDIESTDSSRGN